MGAAAGFRIVLITTLALVFCRQVNSQAVQPTPPAPRERLPAQPKEDLQTFLAQMRASGEATASRARAECAAITPIVVSKTDVSAPMYRVVPIEQTADDPDDMVSSVSMNNAAEVVWNDGSEAFVWGHGKVTELSPEPGDSYVQVGGINDRGEIAGSSSHTVDGAYLIIVQEAVIWDRRGKKDLSNLDDYNQPAPVSINNRGQVLGEFVDGNQNAGDSPGHAFLWQGGRVQDLGNAMAIANNDNGMTVGETGVGSDAFASVWTHGLWKPVFDGTATAINDKGMVVGYQSPRESGRLSPAQDHIFYLSSLSHALFWTGKRSFDLGHGVATGINNEGDIVGDSGQRAVLWRGRELLDLNDTLKPNSGWTLEAALAINDRNQIAAIGRHRGKAYLVLLTPTGAFTKPASTPPILSRMNLVAAPTGAAKVTLYWKGVPGALTYRVTRQPVAGGPMVEVSRTRRPTRDRGNGVLNGWMVTDDGLATDIEYVYRVGAVGAGGVFGRSNFASAAPSKAALPWDTGDARAIWTAAWRGSPQDLDPMDPGPLVTVSDSGVLTGPDGVAYPRPSEPASAYVFNPHPAVRYVLTDLGPALQAIGVNSSGQVLLGVGPPWHGVVWQNGATQDILSPPTSGFNFPKAINEHGDVCGIVNDPSRHQRATVWRNREPTQLESSAEMSGAYGINASGDVVGTVHKSTGPTGPAWGGTDGWLWRHDGTATDVGPIGDAQARLVAINDSGQVAGSTDSAARNEPHAVMGVAGALADLGTLGGGVSEAAAINQTGDVVGQSTTLPGDDHAFLYRSGRMIDLGVPAGAYSSQAEGVNNSDTVVGVSATDQGIRAVLWKDKQIINLTDTLSPGSGWTLLNASGINDKGWIVGIGTINRERHAFLLRPAP